MSFIGGFTVLRQILLHSRLVADLGAALDDQYQMTMANGWKSVRINLGPGMSQLVANHPDLMKIILKTGMQVGVADIEVGVAGVCGQQNDYSFRRSENRSDLLSTHPLAG